LQNDPGAQAFFADTMTAFAFWDDLTDGDAQVPIGRVHQAMWAALLDLPANPFYRAHFEALHPVVKLAALDWMASTTLEKSDKATDDDLMAAFVLGQSWASILLAAATIINGPAAAMQFAPNIRQFALGGGFKAYRAGLEARRARRAPTTPAAPANETIEFPPNAPESLDE
jgi:hypothetical protein